MLVIATSSEDYQGWECVSERWYHQCPHMGRDSDTVGADMIAYSTRTTRNLNIERTRINRTSDQCNSLVMVWFTITDACAEVVASSRFRRMEAVSSAAIHQHAVRHFAISILAHNLRIRLYCII